MAVTTLDEQENLEIANRWCANKGPDWELLDTAGRGGTAPVFTVKSPNGLLALKVLDKEFSVGERGAETEKRIAKQVEVIGDHDCPFLVKIYDGGRFEDRLYILMNKAEGSELASCLPLVPRNNIATIIDQVAQACIFLRGRGLCHRDIKSANIFVSDDFSHATLLDVSVAREIHDPMGLGTDHGNQLPVVATSRYSPPEYLFRLLPASPELWHAVDIYQLGGLIHDLVMRSEMFEAEYQASSTNRYRFAWIVATQTPVISSEDVEPSLLLLGRRALDKDWKRRSALALEDFQRSKENQKKIGLAAIGFLPKRSAGDNAVEHPAQLRQQVLGYAQNLDEQIRAYQRDLGITSIHKITAGPREHEQVLNFEWDLPAGGDSEFQHLHLRYQIAPVETPEGWAMAATASLSGHMGTSKRSVELDLPAIAFADNTADLMFSTCVGAVGDLAAMLVGADLEGK
ncbi:protein kinase domain-containing protein [Rhizobium hidalgonense]|uniref:protein kinase domain-containing protein n=1 Tax=Rhizobium hidalgonense TaxID=1538159 RepID=UPI001105BDD9|nr:protein kinase [Rhizobium hidalgonense]QKK22796.1 protein kinase [Rhizobium hidalgonense]